MYISQKKALLTGLLFFIDDENPDAQMSKKLELLGNLPYNHTFVFRSARHLNLGLIPGAGLAYTWLTTPKGEVHIISDSFLKGLTLKYISVFRARHSLP